MVKSVAPFSRNGTKVALIAAAITALIIAGLLMLSRPGDLQSPETRGAVASAPAAHSTPTPQIAVKASRVDATNPAAPSERRIRTVDEAGAPVGGARIFALSDGIFFEIGASSTEGELRVASADADLWHSLRAVTADRASGITEVPRSRAEIILVLSYAASLTGIVKSGARPIGGVSVVVSETHEAVSLVAAHALATRRDPARVAVSAEDGAFTIFGLDGARQYCLFAGAKGYVASKIFVAGNDKNREVQVKTVYATVVEFAEAGGAPLRISKGARTWPTWGLRKIQNPYFWTEEPGLALAGFDPAATMITESKYTIIAAGEDRGPRIGPTPIAPRFLGYNRGRWDLWLYRLADGLHVEKIEFTPSGVERGTLVIAAQLRNEAAKPIAHRYSLGTLTVANATKDREQYFGYRTIVWSDEANITVSELPVGEYEVRYEPWGRQMQQLLTYPVAVGAGVTNINLGYEPAALRSLGAICLEPVESNGRPHELPLMLSIAPEAKVPRLPRSFEIGPPYLIDGVEPGVYRIGISRPISMSSTLQQSITVTVDPGNLTRAGFVLTHVDNTK